ncbi:helix-turn-helix transcriptional regulator [Lachnospiraceae bacterium OttesenSCG-928-D06]|nr:helix-turn-helix transcriptional regulator [Lachnospiraceae bacterium OttesenSCG-928-D06]
MVFHYIKEIREKNKLTQQEYAELLGVKLEVVISWEEGKITPSIDDIIKISSQFNVSTDYILLGRHKSNIKRAIAYFVIAINIYLIAIMQLIAKLLQYFEFITFNTCHVDARLYLYEYPLNIILVLMVLVLLAAIVYLLFPLLKKINLR